MQGWYINLDPAPLNRCQQLPAPPTRYSRHKQTEEQSIPNRSSWYLIWPNRWNLLELTEWMFTNFTRVLQPIFSRLNFPISFNGLELSRHWQTPFHLTLKVALKMISMISTFFALMSNESLLKASGFKPFTITYNHNCLQFYYLDRNSWILIWS